MWIKKLRPTLAATAIAMALLAPTLSQACTSLLYKDANNVPYSGRTLELSMELPYEVNFFPVGTPFSSKADDHNALNYKTKNAFVAIGITMPNTDDKVAIEGINDKGMTFSMLSYNDAEGPADSAQKTIEVLAAVDLGSWALSQFNTVKEVKEALEKQPVLVTALFDNPEFKTPFHYALHDETGHSIVIEYSDGKQNVYDNPVGVMTNGPAFSWHMTNLNNYTNLSNKDHSNLELSGLSFQQPDSGIATSVLPSSNTSVDRFVRAVYYSHFAEKVSNPDDALLTLSHVMNNFDRPRGITIDKMTVTNIEGIPIPPVANEPGYESEYTSWTTLMDIKRKTMHVRTYDSLNYISFDLNELLQSDTAKSIKLAGIKGGSVNGSNVLLSAD